ncbi:MAG: ComF family protein [bacterium]
MDKVVEQNGKTFLLDLFFPKFCLGCQKEGSYLCEDCKTLLDISEFNYCLCDVKPIRLPPSQTLRQAQGRCQSCSNKKLSGLYFALPYKEKSLTRKLIHQFKYKPYLKDLAKTLSSILIEHFIKAGENTDAVWENSVLVPVPLGKNKLKIRGYNQSEELAKELSKTLKIPMISNALIKIKSTKPQMELKKEEREQNLLNAFGVRPGSDPGLTPQKVFLVDDVYTTGSTMQECARVLRATGVKSVWGVAIAREG